eukprot:COSAG01_NODE_24916_length_761_cov_70.364048_2_plen_47_part_01
METYGNLSHCFGAYYDTYRGGGPGRGAPWRTIGCFTGAATMGFTVAV